MQTELFPKDVTSNVPRITLVGCERLHVEQHSGLIDYDSDHIVLRTARGLMCVTGAGMRFNLYTAGEAMIIGRIDSVAFREKEERA